ncbi:hypothetical protein SCUP234_07347 [Seiridium cupressi]
MIQLTRRSLVYVVSTSTDYVVASTNVFVTETDTVYTTLVSTVDVDTTSTVDVVATNFGSTTVTVSNVVTVSSSHSRGRGDSPDYHPHIHSVRCAVIVTSTITPATVTILTTQSTATISSVTNTETDYTTDSQVTATVPDITTSITSITSLISTETELTTVETDTILSTTSTATELLTTSTETDTLTVATETTTVPLETNVMTITTATQYVTVMTAIVELTVVATVTVTSSTTSLPACPLNIPQYNIQVSGGTYNGYYLYSTPYSGQSSDLVTASLSLETTAEYKFSLSGTSLSNYHRNILVTPANTAFSYAIFRLPATVPTGSEVNALAQALDAGVKSRWTPLGSDRMKSSQKLPSTSTPQSMESEYIHETSGMVGVA